jgi:hypothetical protein
MHMHDIYLKLVFEGRPFLRPGPGLAAKKFTAAKLFRR